MKKILALTACVSFAGMSAATVINFDALSDGDVVTTQFTEATFSTVANRQVQVSAQSLGNSLPNFICTADLSGNLTCTEDVFVAFTNAVNNLTFDIVGDNDTGTVGKVDVTHSGGVTTVNMIGDGNAGAVNTVDLSAFTMVTNLHIKEVTDQAGLGYDDFSFEPVPEPATMTLLGLGALAALRRKKRAA